MIGTRLMGLLTVFIAVLTSCADPGAPVRIGVKDFTEQQILAEMLGLLISDQAPAGVAITPCGDVYGCQRALQQGQLDLLVEYTGTGMVFLGATSDPGVSPLETLRRLYRPLGLTWLDRLGFDNGYRVLVSTERARALGLRTISDLARLKGGVRVTCPAEYLRRPMDGLASLVSRYGLRQRGEPVVLDPLNERFGALFGGRADVAIGYATDGYLRTLNLQSLEDNLSFYPAYDAAVVARASLLKKHPQIKRRLGRLAGRIDEKTMQQLNTRVQVEGWKPRGVARRFLRDQRLIPPRGKAPDGRAPAIKLAVHQADRLESPVGLAVRATRRVFRGRPVVLDPSPDPIKAVIEGRARLAVLGAERFFTPDAERGRLPGSSTMPRRELRLEAAAVLGTRMIHLLRRAGDPSPEDPLAGKIGVAAKGSGSALAAAALLAALGKQPTAHVAPRALLEQVERGTLDGALLLAVPGDDEIARAAARGILRLRSLSDNPATRGAPDALTAKQAMQVPFLRPARIPAETYGGQGAPVETLGAQILIAGPARGAASASAGGGPAAVFSLQSKPLSADQVETLARATRVPEAPDPALPSAWSVPLGGPEVSPQESSSALETLLNLMALAFIIWLGRVVMARHRKAARS